MGRRHRTDDCGFTLIELLVVVVIIGLLAAIAIPTFMGQRQRAKHAAAVSDLRNAATMEEAYFGDNGHYVSTVSTLAAQGLRRTPNVALGIAVSADGYCEVAGEPGQYWWFDSLAGGVQPDSTADLTPPATADAACAVSAPSSVE